VTAYSGSRLDVPTGKREVLADRLGDASAILLVQLTVQASDDAQALDVAKSDREAEVWHRE
jgi:hypothetical protein